MVYVILALAAVLLVLVDVRNLDIAMLQLHSLDEYAFHNSLETMFEGLRTHSFSKLFAFTFYNYGFGFFALNLIPASIFLAIGSYAGSILSPRLVTSVFALASAYLLQRIAKDAANKVVGIWALLFLLAMPGFWTNATWFHPDWMMTSFLLGTLWFLLRDAGRIDRNFWYAVVSFGLAISLGKIQAVTFAPLLALYMFPPTCFKGGRTVLWRKARLGARAAVIVVGLFLVTNPYLIHPKGLHAFLAMFHENMESNATNHGSFVDVGLLDKFQQAILPYYLPWIGVVLLLGVAASLLVRSAREEREWLFGALAATFLLNLAYVLFTVNKAWPTYYLPIICMGIPLLAKGAALLPQRYLHLFLWPALLVQVVSHARDYKSVVIDPMGNRSNPSYQVQLASRDFLKKALTGISPSSHVLVSPYTGFDFPSVGLKFSNVHVIYGSLSHDKLTDPVQMDYVILRNDDVYFDPSKSVIRSRPPFFEGVKIVDSLRADELNYEQFARNTTVTIWKRISAVKSGRIR